MKNIFLLILLIFLLFSCTPTLTYTKMTAPLSLEAQKKLAASVELTKKAGKDARSKGVSSGKINLDGPEGVGYMKFDNMGTTFFMKKDSLPRRDIIFYDKSPAGEVYFEGGHCFWNDDGVTIFVEK